MNHVDRLRESLSGKLTLFADRFFSRIAKHHWRTIGGFTLLIAFLEISELIYKNDPVYDPFHFIELVLFLLMLLTVGVLIDILAKANTIQDQTLEILNYKHNLSLDLIHPEDWDMLTTRLVMLPYTIAEVVASRLHVRSLYSDQMESVASWDVDESNKAEFCQECLRDRIAQERAEYDFNLCQHASFALDPAEQSQEYCLPIFYANQLLALLQFKLRIGDALSPKQKEIFESIRPEMALALRVSQKKKRLSELQLAETALAERHSISNYLHDNLGQNLAYLCLKLDQLSENNELRSDSRVRSDLDQMKDAANQSYQIVRGMIENIHPNTTPRLNNLFSEHAKKVSQRANFEISVKEEGEPLPILAETQQAAFYVFQEALSNIEKYARADQVNVIIQWNEDSLAVTVSDNGIGFNPQNTDKSKHFGLTIMQERIEKLSGQLNIISSENAGTSVAFSFPLSLLVI